MNIFVSLSNCLPITGGMDPRCKICIFMGKTDPDAPKHKQQVMVDKWLAWSSRGMVGDLPQAVSLRFALHSKTL